jgi:hypothetical protein
LHLTNLELNLRKYMRRDEEKLSRFMDKTERVAKYAATLGAIGIVGFLGKGCVGTKGQEISIEQASTEAQIEYDEIFENSSASGKFLLQYIEPTKINVVKYKDNGGLIAFFHEGSEGHGGDDYVYNVSVNNGCLKSTAYDIAGGTIEGEFHGLFSSGEVNGNVPTAAAYAYVDKKDPDKLLVQSGHSNSKDLNFTGLLDGEALIPADSQTESVLETYGCETGISKVVEGSTIGLESSPWVPNKIG